jgi:hypothetical protein
MVNNWVQHVKREASKLNISYMCAASTPAVRVSYNKLNRPQRAGNRPHKDEIVEGPKTKPATASNYFSDRKIRQKASETERKRQQTLPNNKKIIDDLNYFFKEDKSTYKNSETFKNKSELLNTYNQIKLYLDTKLKTKLQKKLKV